MPKGFTEHEKQLIREQLLEQGCKQFAAYGLKKTSVEELATAAGISKGAFYLFYPSKEALFMEVVEKAEQLFRREVLAAIDLPGPSPRARLFAVWKTAFQMWKTIPVLRFFTSSDYDILSRKIPAEILQEHLQNDQKFIAELVDRCREAGIPIRAPVEEITNLSISIFFTSLHEDDFGPERLTGAADILLELFAAFCLGEVMLQVQNPIIHLPMAGERS